MPDAVDPTLPRPLVEGPSAWTGRDLAGRPEQWTYRLSADEIAEIDAATHAVMARGIEMAAIGKADFPLPRFGATLDALRREILEGRGFVLIRGLPTAGKSIRENAVAFW